MEGRSSPAFCFVGLSDFPNVSWLSACPPVLEHHLTSCAVGLLTLMRLALSFRRPVRDHLSPAGAFAKEANSSFASFA
jgi:hypothetical protein